MTKPIPAATLAKSFAPADARLALTAERSPAFDRETVTLARLTNFVAKGLANHANHALKRHGLNHTGYAVMVMLYGSIDQTLTPSQLVDATHEKSANITRICDDLLRQGLISREVDSHDRRKVQVRLSPAGEVLITRVLPDVVSVTQNSFALLDSAERLQLACLLRKVIEGQEHML
jgi:MarR family transcriptional repressor of emrRAB